MKYKVGDRVRIKSLEWYNENKKNSFKNLSISFTHEMSKFCGKIVTIEEITENAEYHIKEDYWRFFWTDEMIEGLVEEKVSLKLTGKAIKNNEMVVSVSEYILPEGYQFKDENGNVINATKIVLEKKKKKYPKTYEECLVIIPYDKEERILYLLEKFKQLLIARDAYWKIAGEEMGLGKPWEPDWTKADERKYCIVNTEGNITKWVQKTTNKILAFPTEEMRDAFKENFDPDIEICKEFL